MILNWLDIRADIARLLAWKEVPLPTEINGEGKATVFEWRFRRFNDRGYVVRRFSIYARNDYAKVEFYLHFMKATCVLRKGFVWELRHEFAQPDYKSQFRRDKRGLMQYHDARKWFEGRKQYWTY